MGECYICLEETFFQSPCKCTNLPLCENCLEKLRIYNYKECKVCKEKYPLREEEVIDIKIEEIQRPTVHRYTPYCCRRYLEKTNVVFCFIDILINILAFLFVLFTMSCLLLHFDKYQCTDPEALLISFFPSLISYIVVSCCFNAYCTPHR